MPLCGAYYIDRIAAFMGGRCVQETVSPNMQLNRKALERVMGTSVDLVYREFTSGVHGVRRGLLVFLDGLADGGAVESLLVGASRFANPPFEQPAVHTDPILNFRETLASSTELKVTQKLQEAVQAVLAGEAAMFLEGATHALLADTRHNIGRGAEEPATESEIRGPREGFAESIRLNTALIRRRIRDPKLRIDPLVIGERTRTDLAIVYMDGLASPDLVAEVRRRLEHIEIDSVLESGYIDELIQDNPLSLFGPLFSTERPDRVAGAILEGRVGILTDNTPFVLIAPTTLWQFLQAPGDYYHNYWAASAILMVRLLATVVGVALPSLYLLLTTFHHEMIPTPLALSIAGGREGTPMPTMGEVLGMMIMFEIMHEAGLRLPRAVGQTVSIVGALVIGQAAVEAGLVSPATVIVIATSGISAFAIPNYGASLVVRLLRFPLVLVSGTLGVFGFVCATTVLALHLSSLRSFGVPFLQPVAPLVQAELKDTIIRVPWWAMIMRPTIGSGRKTQRAARGQRPSPQKPKGGPRP